MYNFTRSDWTIEATHRKRERLKEISDADLLSEMESAHRMCSPGSYWGKGPRLAYVIQRELVRLEICTRGASYTESLDRQANGKTLGEIRDCELRSLL